jgi:hypothetical protein
VVIRIVGLKIIGLDNSNSKRFQLKGRRVKSKFRAMSCYICQCFLLEESCMHYD